jgi:hypothetical protein
MFYIRSVRIVGELSLVDRVALVRYVLERGAVWVLLLCKVWAARRLDGDVDSWQSIRLYLMEQSCFFGYLLQRKGIYIRHGSRKCYMHLAGRPGGPGSTSSRCCESSDGPAYVVRCLLQLNTGPCSLQY